MTFAGFSRSAPDTHNQTNTARAAPAKMTPERVMETALETHRMRFEGIRDVDDKRTRLIEVSRHLKSSRGSG